MRRRISHSNNDSYNRSMSKDKNIDNYGYIGILILRIYKKYQWNENYSKFVRMLEKTPKNDKISKNTHFKIIL